MLNELDSDAMQKTVPVVMQMLNAMREADVSNTQGFGGSGADGNVPYSSWKDYLLRVGHDDPERRPDGWRAKLANSPIGDSVFMEALERLKELVDVCPEKRHLVHGDLPYSNVLVKVGQISTVIDWGNSVYGDFLYDIALLVYYWSWFSKWKDINIKQEVLAHYESICLATISDSIRRMISQLSFCDRMFKLPSHRVLPSIIASLR